MNEKLKKFLIILFPIAFIIGIFAFIKSAFTGFLSELEVNPDLKIKFYWVDNWDLNYDLYYKVYINGRRVFKSEAFFYALGDTMEPPIFKYYKLADRYVAIYNVRDPNSILIIIDLKEGIYGKLNRKGPVGYHNKFNSKMITILNLFKKSTGNSSLSLDGFHYNFQSRDPTEQSHSSNWQGDAVLKIYGFS